MALLGLLLLLPALCATAQELPLPKTLGQQDHPVTLESPSLVPVFSDAYLPADDSPVAIKAGSMEAPPPSLEELAYTPTLSGPGDAKEPSVRESLSKSEKAIPHSACGDGSLDSQTPPYFYGAAYTSDATPGYLNFEKFTASAPIVGVTWWGQELDYNAAAWTPCERGISTFKIWLYNDSNGAWYSENVQARRTRVVNGSADTCYRYDAALQVPQSIASGRIGIQATGSGECWFLWLQSYYYYDGAHDVWNGSGFTAYSTDLAFCINTSGYGETCLPGAIVSQPPLPPGASEGAYVSEYARTGYASVEAYEYFPSVSQDVFHVRWWGQEGVYTGSWSPCLRPNTSFYIDFFNLDGSFLSSETVTATRVLSGASQGSYPIYQYDANLSAPVAFSGGWLGIQGASSPDCWFMWYTSAAGDGYMELDSGSITTYATDLAVCLSPLETAPACAAEAAFGQSPHGPDESWTSLQSRETGGISVYDDFSGLTAPITGVEWYGLEAYMDGSNWTECQSPYSPFNIRFTTAGMTVIKSYSVYPARTDTGILYDGYTLYKYSVNFPAVSMESGFIGIERPGNPDCGFLWLSAPGNNYATYLSGGAWYGVGNDFAFCLLGTAPAGGNEGSVTSNYASANVPQTVSSGNTIYSTLSIGDNYQVRDVNVTLDVNVAFGVLVSAWLVGPNGTTVQLFANVGEMGSNFTNTVLDDEAGTAIYAGAAPYTGSYRPMGALSAFDGSYAQGTWQLAISMFPGYAGYGDATLNSWSLDLKTNPRVTSIVCADANPTVAQSVNYTVTFNTDVTGVDTSDFALNTSANVTGASVTAVSADSGATRTVSVDVGTVAGDGSIRLDVVDDDTIIDGSSVSLGGPGAGNGNFNSGEAYTVQRSGYTYVMQFGGYGSGDGQLAYPIGLGVDSSEDVYVVDSSNHRVQKFTSAGAYVTQWGSIGFGNGEFYYPSCMAVDVSGNVYVSDGRIQKFTSSGSYLTQWGSYGNGLAVDGSGYVYVADSGNLRIQKFTSSGSFVTSWFVFYPLAVTVDAVGNVYASTYYSGIQKFTSSGDYLLGWGGYGEGDGEFLYPGGLTLDASGNVYVVDRDQHRVQKFTSDGAYLTQWGTYGTGIGQFNGPRAAAVDASGNVYVSDSGNYRIQKFLPPLSVSSIVTANANPTNAASVDFTVTFSEEVTGVDLSDFVLTTSGVAGASLTAVSSDSGAIRTVTVSTGTGDGTIRLDVLDDDTIISPTAAPLGGPGAGNGDFSAGEAYILDRSYLYLEQFGGSGSGNGQFSGPQGITVALSGDLYVSDSGNNRIEEFTSAGTYVTQWGSTGNGASQFSSPRGNAVDSAGNVYVADVGNDRIQKFSSSGAFITQWATGDGPGDVTLDNAGNVYVAIITGSLIEKYTDTGVYVAQLAGSGSGSGQVNTPRAIACDGAGSLYIADTGNNRVQVISTTGAFIAEWGTAGSGDGQFNAPYGLTVDVNGKVIVADTGNNRFQVFTSTGIFVKSRGTLGSGDGQLNFPTAVDTDSSGNVYVADTGNDRIQKFSGDSIPAVASILRADPNPTNAQEVNFLVSFNEEVTGVDAGDFTLASSGLPGAFVTAISADTGSTRTVTVNTGTGDGTIGLDLIDDDTIQDLATGPLGGAGANNGDFLTGEIYTLDRSGPEVSLSSPSLTEVNTTITVQVDLNDSTSDFDAGDITPTNATIVYFAGSGAGYIFLLTPLAEGEFSAVVNAGVCTDAAGNPNNASNILSRTYDSLPPAVTVDALSTTNTTPTLTGTVSDSGSGVAQVNVTVNGEVYPTLLDAGAWTATVTTPLAPGTYDVIAEASDAVGNTGADGTTDELIIESVVSLAEAWVDFAWTGVEDGSSAQPFNTLAEGVNAVVVNGTVKVKGNTALHTSSEVLSITKKVRIQAIGGPVRIGEFSRAAVPSSAEASAPATTILEALKRLITGE